MKLFKKKKAKGFTLVELIVVMAIIGVLAAVLIPQMVGFMRDSRISRANQNAAVIHTAATAALTQRVIASGTNDTKDKSFAGNVTGGVLELADSAAATATKINLGNYMNVDTFNGSCLIYTTTSGDAVSFALWSDAVDLSTTYVEADAKGYNPANAAAQITANDAGNLVGAYPAP